MAVPTKKIYGRNGKVIFDPSNPEDVRNYKEKQPLMEALKLVQGLVDPRGGGGIGAMAKGISKAIAKETIKKVAKSTTKSTIKRSPKKVTTTVKEVVETKPTIPTTVPSTISNASDKIKSLSNAEIKAFENVKNVRELAEKQVKNVSNVEKRKPSLRGYTPEEAKQVMRDILSKNKGKQNKVAERRSLEGKIISLIANKETAFRESVKQSIKESNAKSAMSIAALTSVLGGGAGATYYGMQLSNKDNKQTTTPQKTGPVDLKRITNTKPSSIPGVSIVKGTDGKDYGIVWDNKNKNWDYYRGGGTKIKPQETVKNERTGLAIGGGDSDSGGGSVIKPRSATGQAFDKAFAEARKQAGGAAGIFEWNGKKYGTALVGETVPKDRVEVGKTATTLMGDEYYKKDPRLETLRQQDDDRQLLARAEAQKKEMEEFEPTKSLDVLPMPTKPLSSLIFKTSALNPLTNSRVEPVSYDTIDTKSKNLKKKRYGGNLSMLKYMKK